jgi:hypothetical protein
VSRLLREGAGWRLGWDPQGIVYQGLIGTDDWAVELTSLELEMFCRLLGQLDDTLRAIAPQLMAEERICCEAEGNDLWLEAEGFPGNYSLRLILSQGRRVEGHWPAEAVQGLLQASRLLQAF